MALWMANFIGKITNIENKLDWENVRKISTAKTKHL